MLWSFKHVSKDFWLKPSKKQKILFSVFSAQNWSRVCLYCIQSFPHATNTETDSVSTNQIDACWSFWFLPVQSHFHGKPLRKTHFVENQFVLWIKAIQHQHFWHLPQLWSTCYKTFQLYMDLRIPYMCGGVTLGHTNTWIAEERKSHQFLCCKKHYIYIWVSTLLVFFIHTVLKDWSLVYCE